MSKNHRNRSVKQQWTIEPHRATHESGFYIFIASKDKDSFCFKFSVPDDIHPKWDIKKLQVAGIKLLMEKD